MRRQSDLQVLTLFLNLIVGLFLLSGCTLSKQDHYPDTVQVKLPWYQDGKYSFHVIDLFTVQNMVELRGKVARFLLSPSLQDGKLVGFEPRINAFRNVNGVYIPTDTFSTELLSLYAHFEKLQILDKKIGVAGYIDNWQEQKLIAVQTQIIEEGNRKKLDNAMYSGDLDAFLFVPYVQEHLPLSVNAGVIGHEYFHDIFHKIVTKPIQAQEKTEKNATARQLYHTFLFRSLNEALADVWGWIYSDDFQFVKKSDPRFEWRDLNSRVKNFYTKEQIQEKSASYLSSDAEAYQVGQMYSYQIFSAVKKALEERIVENKIQANMLVAKSILKMLLNLQKEYLQMPDTELLDPMRPLGLLQEQIPDFKIMPPKKESIK